MPNPWAVLADTDLVLDRQHIEELGRYYAAERAIVVRRGLLLVEERSVLWHELAHWIRGDRRCDSGTRDEVACDRLAARLAVPVEALIAAWRVSQDVHEVADMLKVTPQLLQVRLDHLHAGEQARVLHHRQGDDE
ncbi:MAG: hypothetical protein JWM93_2429 [Frankiales bacterium]|nr:hypothetical protein [Frankiales bacterium]